MKTQLKTIGFLWLAMAFAGCAQSHSQPSYVSVEPDGTLSVTLTNLSHTPIEETLQDSFSFPVLTDISVNGTESKNLIFERNPSLLLPMDAQQTISILPGQSYHYTLPLSKLIKIIFFSEATKGIQRFRIINHSRSGRFISSECTAEFLDRGLSIHVNCLDSHSSATIQWRTKTWDSDATPTFEQLIHAKDP